MSDIRANAMLSELQSQINVLSTRAALLAADLAAANGRVAELTAVEAKASPDNVAVVPEESK